MIIIIIYNNNNTNKNNNNSNNINNNNLFAESDCGSIQHKIQFRVKKFYHKLAITTSKTINFIFNSIASRQCAGKRKNKNNNNYYYYI